MNRKAFGQNVIICHYHSLLRIKYDTQNPQSVKPIADSAPLPSKTTENEKTVVDFKELMALKSEISKQGCRWLKTLKIRVVIG